MSDLTTDEVRDTWVDTQLLDIPTAQAVRLVQGLQIHFDRWLAGERQQARREVLADLRAKVMNLPSRVELNEAGHEQTWVRYADVRALLDEEAQP